MHKNSLMTWVILATVLAAPRSAGAEAKRAQDFFVGNGTAGPYALSWRHVLAGTETVTVNNVPLAWGVDYALDPDSGTLTFTHPLPAQAGAAVRYGYDTRQAKPQGTDLSLPLAFALNDHVSLNGAYSHAAADGETPGTLTMGLSGGWRGANGGALTTRLLFVPAMTGADAQAAPDGLARLGFAAEGQTNIGTPLRLSYGFSHAGQGVGDQGSDNWRAGVQKTTLSAAFDPVRQVQTTFGYAQTRSAGGGGGPVQTLTASAAVTPTGKIEMGADFTQKRAAGQADDAQTLHLRATLSTGKVLSLAATDTQTSIGQGGVTQTQTAAVTLTPLDRTEFDASLSRKDAPGTNNDAQALGLRAAIGAGRPVSLSASLDQSSQGNQNSGAQSVRLSLNPRPAFQLNTGLSRSQSPTASRQVAAVDGRVQPWAFLLLSGGYQWRTVTPAPERWRRGRRL